MKQFTEVLRRLTEAGRFSQTTLYKSESVMEHSGMVCLLSLAIGHRINDIASNPNSKIDMGILLTKAIIHDVEESHGCDFPMPVKQDHLLYAPIKAYERRIAAQVLGASGLGKLEPLWRTAKERPEGMIVSFADQYVVLMKFHDEIVMRGNRNMAKLIVEDFYRTLNEKQRAIAETWQAPFFEEFRSTIALFQLEINNVR